MTAVTQTTFNQSRVKMFRRCQRQYAFRYDTAGQLGLEPTREMVPKVRKLPLYKGSWMHALQEALHKEWAGLDTFTVQIGEGKKKLLIEAETWRDVQAALTKQFNALFEEERDELGDLPGDCERLFKSYLRFWKQDRDTYEVATLPDGSPAVEFIIEVDLAPFGIEGKFKGRIDLMVVDNEYEGLWLWDAKWMKKIPPPDERMMSPQNPLYVWGVEKTYDLELRGFVYNYGRSKAPTVPNVLKRGSLSVAKKIDTDQATFFQAIKDTHGEDWRRWLPFYKEKLLDLKGREQMWFDRQRIPVETDRQLKTLREFVASVRDIQRRETRVDYVPRSYFYNCRFNCEYHGPCVAEYQGLHIEPLIKDGFMFEEERYGKEEDLLKDG